MKLVKQLLHSASSCVLATCSSTGPSACPHTSLMGWLPTDSGRTVYLATSTNTQKYTNITATPAVSLLVDNRETAAPDNVMALTMAGTAAVAENQQQVLESLTAARPHLSTLCTRQDTVALEITIHSLLLFTSVQSGQFWLWDSEEQAFVLHKR